MCLQNLVFRNVQQNHLLLLMQLLMNVLINVRQGILEIIQLKHVFRNVLSRLKRLMVN